MRPLGAGCVVRGAECAHRCFVRGAGARAQCGVRSARCCYAFRHVADNRAGGPELAAPAAAQGGQGGRVDGGQGRPSRPPSIAERTQDLKKLDGFFPLYWDEAAGTLLMEIPRFNEEVLYLNGLAAGLGSNDIGLDRAQLGGTRIVRFERVGPKILMTEPNYDYRATSTNPAERKAVQEAFAQSVIWGFTVAAETDGRVLVDLSDFLMRDTHGVAGRLTPAQYRFDRTRSAIYHAEHTRVSAEHRNRSDDHADHRGRRRPRRRPGAGRRPDRRRHALARSHYRAPASFFRRAARRQLQAAPDGPALRVLRRELRGFLRAVRDRRPHALPQSPSAREEGSGGGR